MSQTPHWYLVTINTSTIICQSLKSTYLQEWANLNCVLLHIVLSLCFKSNHVYHYYFTKGNKCIFS